MPDSVSCGQEHLESITPLIESHLAIRQIHLLDQVGLESAVIAKASEFCCCWLSTKQVKMTLSFDSFDSEMVTQFGSKYCWLCYYQVGLDRCY